MEKTIYPKVKIRVQDQDDNNSHGRFKMGSLFTLKDIRSLFATNDSSFPVAVKQPQDDPPSPVVRIPDNYVPSVLAMPRVSDLSVFEETKQIDDLEISITKASLSDKQINEDDRSSSSTVSSNKNKQNDDGDKLSIGDSLDKNKQNDDDEDRVNIRATSIPRPRAVLSSPVNDAVVGGQKKTNPPRASALKNSNPVPNRHLQCRVAPSHTDNESHVNIKNKSKDKVGNESPINTKSTQKIGNESPINTRDKSKDNIGNESPINTKNRSKDNIGNKSPINTKKANDVADRKSDLARKKVVPLPPVSIRSPGRYVKTSKPRPVWI